MRRNRVLTIADVIFPAFFLPYAAQFFFPLAALVGLGTEVGFYRWWSKDGRLGRIALVVLVANVASSLLGILLAGWLPAGYHPAFPARSHGPWQGPEWNTLAAIAWPVAFIVSVIVEWPILLLFRRFVAIPRALVAALFANAASYAALLLVLLMSALMSRW